MPDFPDIMKPDYDLSEEIILPQVRTEFEAGYVHSRPRVTRARRRWSLTWKALPELDYQLLATFFTDNQGSTFAWTHPGFTGRLLPWTWS